ncbi:MAG TPA: cupredoxin domain-containing protein [Gaiellaceae bacterium]|jgi:plastocyanin
MRIVLGAILVAAVFALAGCGGGGGGDSDSGGNVVKFTDNGFEPSTLTINSGDTVKFENDSSDDFWPASNVHPTHLLYPGFDAKKPILSGDSYSFTFTKVGSWGYHNHLEPDVQGTIVVK